METAIEVSGLSMHYGDFVAVDDIDLSVAEGEILASVSYTHLTLPTKA